MIKEAIAKKIEGNNLTENEAYQVMLEIMEGRATDAQIGGFLVALRRWNATVEEVVAFTRVMREKATRIPAPEGPILDTCGTGGDSSGTFNISTVTAFIAAGAGVTVAKHGNRSVSSTCGSADLLKELGIQIELEPESLGRCLKEIGIAFLFAPLLHGAMKYAIGPRRELGVRTVFNVLGPMTNPAGANRQLMGVYSPTLVEMCGKVLSELGSEHVITVYGSDGLDEITTTGSTMIFEVKNGQSKTYEINPEDYGIARAYPEELKCGSPAESADIFLSLLSGEKGPKRDAVLLNGAFAIYAGGMAENPGEGIEKARESIDSGAALEKFNSLKDVSTR